ncbi:unnamed protein product [marine sediment metagenome]|uniref:Glycosyltransferase 2-like domain-containing protein n=1 Tax=marine sediment metagenome TaxID=412755 RepID=X1SDD9_9ZZZZ
MCNKPLISIGLPVFNGEKYLDETLNSIMTQTYFNFELIISDNASTDLTQQICRSYEAKDNRIKYYRNKKNIGASKNFNLVYKLSSGEYFKWAAHDDILDPNFLYRCLKVLEGDPSIALCYSKTGIIDESGRLIGAYEYTRKINSQKTYERFGNLLGFSHPTYAIFGLIPSNVLSRTQLISNYIGSDRNLLAEISLLGRLYEIPENLIFIRKHSRSYSYIYDKFPRLRITWWDPMITRRIIYTTNVIEFFKSIGNIQLNWFERLLCYAYLVRWFILEGWPKIYEDIETTFLGRSILAHRVASELENFNLKVKRIRFLR